MFSKALFKQSCKANGMMWAIITFAVCFMLACVMLISGTGNISKTIGAVEDTIISQQLESSFQSRAINYYEIQTDGMQQFDKIFSENLQTTLTTNPNVLLSPDGLAGIYANSISQLQAYLLAKAQAIDPTCTAQSTETLEIIGCVLYAIVPTGQEDIENFYHSYGEDVPGEYFNRGEITTNLLSGTLDEYFSGEARQNFIVERAKYCTPIFLAGNVVLPENVDRLLEQLAKYDVTKEKYDSFGYDYAGVKQLANKMIVTYAARLDDAIQNDEQLNALDKTTQAEQYQARLAEIKAELGGEVTKNFLTSLPEEVSSAFEEIGQLNLYGVVVGSIFFRLAGLLLPIIYMIMAANNLIAGQVDSGSMAYVLSTSTKRQTVVFTQAVFLISSLFAMFCLTTVTSCVCLAIVGVETAKITFGQIVLLNVGAFLVLFALSGLCFFTSCWFDRSKRSMAIGGGLSIFALVAAMLGLFGSKVIPSVVRLDALNYFNYSTIITLFDAISIIDGTLTFLWKFAILLVLGVVGYVVGAMRFIKKDLPL